MNPGKRTSYVVIIGHALYSPWKEILYSGQLKTWADPNNPNIYHAYGKPVKGIVRYVDDLYWKLRFKKHFGKFVLLLELLISPFVNKYKPKISADPINKDFHGLLIDMPDLNILMNSKAKSLLKYGSILKNEYIVFTTSSSYLNLKLLEEKLSQLPKDNLAAGRINYTTNGSFLSGSFRVFTPDVLKKISESSIKLKSWLPEDLALGKKMELLDIRLTNIESIDLDSEESIRNLTQLQMKSIVHFRLKSIINGIRIDSKLMKILHNEIQDNLI